MIRRPPRSTRTDTLFPYTTLFRSLRGVRAKLATIPRRAAFHQIPLEPVLEWATLRPIDVQPPCRRFFVLQHSHQLPVRSEEHTSELQSLMRISYAVFCLKKKIKKKIKQVQNEVTNTQPSIHP